MTSEKMWAGVTALEGGGREDEGEGKEEEEEGERVNGGESEWRVDEGGEKPPDKLVRKGKERESITQETLFDRSLF